MEAPATASAASDVARTLAGKGRASAGRYLALVRFSLISSATSRRRAQMHTGASGDAAAGPTPVKNNCSTPRSHAKIWEQPEVGPLIDSAYEITVPHSWTETR